MTKDGRHTAGTLFEKVAVPRIKGKQIESSCVMNALVTYYDVK